MLIDIGAISGATPQTTSATWVRLMTRDPVTEAQKTRWRSETPHPAHTRPARPEATRPKPITVRSARLNLRCCCNYRPLIVGRETALCLSVTSRRGHFPWPWSARRGVTVAFLAGEP